ncbi:MAG: hypothetical protein J2P46_21935, partial [Zavarzinella sp.]|nr:hypothetical protein [Zavarzinella sp.]
LGDWSPVRTAGWGRRLVDLTEHPSLRVEPADAAARNGRANRALVARLDALAARTNPPPEGDGRSAGRAGA